LIVATGSPLSGPRGLDSSSPHYKTVFAKAQTPAIQAKAYNFAKNENPQYWCKKLGSKPALLEECEKRHISAKGIDIKSNREIASILITFDKEFKNY